jgi:hypothetical protein
MIRGLGIFYVGLLSGVPAGPSTLPVPGHAGTATHQGPTLASGTVPTLGSDQGGGVGMQEKG